MCEKCWGDAYLRWMGDPQKTQADHYADLLVERRESPCTPDEQAGQFGDTAEATEMTDSARTEEIRAEWREAAKGIAEDAHCRYCDFQNQDSRLKCKRDVEFAVKEIVKLVESETAALREEVERLKGVLEKYGGHHLDCDQLKLHGGSECSCGFDAALSPSSAQEPESA